MQPVVSCIQLNITVSLNIGHDETALVDMSCSTSCHRITTIIEIPPKTPGAG
ncbi:hypothetical protein [Endozoicomonas arenosclerae]|uniref:hypothetical protein n=1 Tax=Endozoicomonas arenosclerae TaxID=1633495 RepID=UPI00155FF1BE|nr:hypothetical protein [Endozoicomonas arenosclerae]